MLYEVITPAIRKPTVTKPRLRVSLGALLDKEDIDFFVEELKEAIFKMDR